MGDEDFWPDAQSERGEVARGAHIDVDAGGDQAAGGQPSRAEGYANAFMQLVGTHGGGRRADRVGVQRLGHPRQGWSLGRRLWRLQQQRRVGTVAVVMLDVDPKDLLEV